MSSSTAKQSATLPQSINRPRKRHQISGPYSRIIDRGALGTINGSTKEGRFLRAYEKMLIEHVGGNPSITQRALISRTARLALHLELLDERSIKEGRALGPTDYHFYAVWANALARHLAKLGFAQAAPAQMDALEYGKMLAREEDAA